jgi:uncharacterized repeat protein (TIGR01451 family)
LQGWIVYRAYFHVTKPLSRIPAPTTMKHTTLLALLMGLHLTTAAQWVTIPDSAFVARLAQLYPDCMNGDQLDSQCPAVLAATSLNVGVAGIFDLTGIEYFVNLQELYCYGNNLTALPELPGSLTYLSCDGNSLTVLPDLPGSLTELWCTYNSLTVLPALPGSLTLLSCRNNSLTALPALPGSLTHLNCSYNSLTALPALPGSLIHLWCNDNSLSALPELPGSLRLLDCAQCDLAGLPSLPSSLLGLYCHGNALSVLPALPGALTQLYCFNNALTALPVLPSTILELLCHNNALTALPALPSQLTTLVCYNNVLTELPSLPASLTWLGCQDNDLVALPALPGSLTVLRSENNSLGCLPNLPQSLSNSSLNNFNISSNPFTCLPNYVPAMSGPNAQWLAYPLCDLADLDNNPYGCSSFEGIVGTAFDDEDQNCLLEEPEPGLVNIPIKLLDDQGIQLAMTNSLANGVYNFVAGEGEYTVQLVTEDMPYQASCPIPGDLQDVELTAADPAARDVDFGVECLPSFDVGVQSVVQSGWVFPGQVHILRVAAGDMSTFYGLQCAAGVAGAVTVQVDGPVSYVGPAPGALTPTETGPLQFTYTIADFAAVNMEEDFRLQLQTDTTATDDDVVCVTVMVSPIADDLNPGNNTYSQCYPVVNSYDPNIKTVWPVNVGPGFDGYFTYTIYFQNTGSAPAFNIRIADTLDTQLDVSTFAVSGYSHPVLTYLSGNLLTFRFNNIMLPDSTSDPEGSIGHVQYRIKPLPGLEVGTVIENTAHIYFDFNEAIVTNTTQNVFTTTTGVEAISALVLRVFPNPGNGLFQVALNTTFSGPTHLEVYDLAGMRVAEQRVEGALSVLDLSGQSAGLYLLRVWNERGSEVVRVVKQ